MKTAISFQLSAFSQSLARHSVGCALRTIPFFNNPPSAAVSQVPGFSERYS